MITMPNQIGVAFDGTSNLVTYFASDPRGVRVSSAGDLLGTTTLVSGPGVAGEAGVAAGNSGFLVAYSRQTNGFPSDVAAVAGSSDGTPSPPSVVAARVGRRMAFGGGALP